MEKKKLYVTGWHTKSVLDKHFSESGKAFYLEIKSGHWTSGHNRCVWFPVSQCIFGEVNECGNYNVSIPYWLVKNAGLQKSEIWRLELENTRLEMI